MELFSIIANNSLNVWVCAANFLLIWCALVTCKQRFVQSFRFLHNILFRSLFISILIDTISIEMMPIVKNPFKFHSLPVFPSNKRNKRKLQIRLFLSRSFSLSSSRICLWWWLLHCILNVQCAISNETQLYCKKRRNQFHCIKCEKTEFDMQFFYFFPVIQLFMLYFIRFTNIFSR